MSAVTSKRGFEIVLQASGHTGQAQMQLVVCGDSYHLYTPISLGVAPNHDYAKTTLSIREQPVELFIDCKALTGRLVVLAKANIVSLKGIQQACLDKTFEQFLKNIERPLRWNQHLIQCIKKEEVPSILSFLHQNIPKWEKFWQAYQRVFVPRKDYGFEYCSNGSIWMYYTYPLGSEMQSLVINLETGEKAQSGKYSQKDENWKKHLAPCVNGKKISILLAFLHLNIPKWEKLCQERVFIPGIDYSFEYCSDSSIWVYYTYPLEFEMQSLVTNLETGEIFQSVKYSYADGIKLRNFSPLFKPHEGILCFSGFFETEGQFIGKHPLPDESLFERKFRLGRKKLEAQLLHCLATLEREILPEKQEIKNSIQRARKFLTDLGTRKKVVEEIINLLLGCLDSVSQKTDHLISLAIKPLRATKALEKEFQVALQLLQGLNKNDLQGLYKKQEIKRSLQRACKCLPHLRDHEKEGIAEISDLLLGCLDSASEEIGYQIKLAIKLLRVPQALEKEEAEWQFQIALQLVRGLSTLERNKIVHCGIVPSALLLRDDKAFLSNFEYAYQSPLPEKRLVLPAKWGDFIPPECTFPLDQLSHPFAIAIYQLGKCFEVCFPNNPLLVPVIERMIHPDPSLRWTASHVLEELDGDKKESSP